MRAPEKSTVRLARRLRALREEHWPGRSITQSQLAQALSNEKPVSVPLISSWESLRSPRMLPQSRLSAYATFFATKRSVLQEPFQLLKLSELTAEERTNRSKLLLELTELRDAATEEVKARELASVREPARDSLWQFLGRPVTIVCGSVPANYYNAMPYNHYDNPNHVELYGFADLDPLIEIYGHIRALNPISKVTFRTSQDLTNNDYANHLVVLGGVDWNRVARDLMQRIPLPVRQIPHASVDPQEGVEWSYFEVVEEGKPRSLKPILHQNREQVGLLEDVALFYRGPSPYNPNSTITLCNGIFSRGTLGAVRAVIDPRFCQKNESFLRHRFAGADAFGVVTRVPFANGKIVTPDWTVAQNRLFEWPSS